MRGLTEHFTWLFGTRLGQPKRVESDKNEDFLFHTNFCIVLIFSHEIFITNEYEIQFSIQWLSQFFLYITLF